MTRNAFTDQCACLRSNIRKIIRGKLTWPTLHARDRNRTSLPGASEPETSLTGRDNDRNFPFTLLEKDVRSRLAFDALLEDSYNSSAYDSTATGVLRAYHDKGSNSTLCVSVHLMGNV